MDIRAGSIHPKSDPPNAGTEQLDCQRPTALERFVIGGPIPGLVAGGSGSAHGLQLPHWFHEVNPSRYLCNKATKNGSARNSTAIFYRQVTTSLFLNTNGLIDRQACKITQLTLTFSSGSIGHLRRFSGFLECGLLPHPTFGALRMEK